MFVLQLDTCVYVFNLFEFISSHHQFLNDDKFPSGTFDCQLFFCRIPLSILIQLCVLPLPQKHFVWKCCHITFWWSFRAIFSEKKIFHSFYKRAMKAEIIIIENCFLYAQLWATNKRRKMWSSEDEGENEWARDFPFVCTSLIGIAIFASLMVHKLSYFFSWFRWRSLAFSYTHLWMHHEHCWKAEDYSIAQVEIFTFSINF